MSKKKVAIYICRRAACLMFRNSGRSPEILNARDFIARCYQISQS